MHTHELYKYLQLSRYLPNHHTASAQHLLQLQIYHLFKQTNPAIFIIISTPTTTHNISKTTPIIPHHTSNNTPHPIPPTLHYTTPLTTHHIPNTTPHLQHHTTPPTPHHTSKTTLHLKHHITPTSNISKLENYHPHS